VQTISVVIPVYRGESVLAATVDEVLRLTENTTTPRGVSFRVSEIILVDDNGPDHSDRIIRQLATAHSSVHPAWLSRNFGQHAATLAGIAQSVGDWVVTLDEDGQQDPADIGTLLDAAVQNSAQVVYGKALNPPPHGAMRNLASRASKRITANLSGNAHATDFNSYRLILGSVARDVAEYVGPGVYLDVALSWVAGRYATAGITLRGEQRASGYSSRALLSHFWRLVISSGTKTLRLVTFSGVILAAVGLLVAIWLVIVKLAFGIDSQGWTSLIVIMLVGFGAVLFVLGIMGEYIGSSLNLVMGKPLYVVTSDPAEGPLQRDGYWA
jgi:glycosyltransferase involved in cell wall biosynthesis